jgi:hypothetical protein
MVTRTVVCPDCGETVPYGRLSCPACGSLLAAVAGAPRRSEPLAAVAVTEAPTLDDGANEEPPPPPAVVRNRAKPGRRHEAVTADDDSPLTHPTPAHQNDASAASATPASSIEPRGHSDDEGPAPVGQVPPILHDWPAGQRAATADPEAHRYEHEQSWDTDDGHEPAVPLADPPHPAAVGAYVPPSSPTPPTDGGAGSTLLTPAATPVVAGGAAYVRAAATPMRPFGASIQVEATPDDAVPESRKPLRTGDAPLLADLPFDAPDTLNGWLVTAGAGLTALSFLLPWISNVADYFGAWGLAVPSRVLPLIAALALLWLSATPNRLPTWLRSAVLPLVLGGLMLGLVWSSVFGNRAAFGVLAATAGALLLVVGGALSVKPARHAEPDSTV